jgi:hypothetical protein
MPPARSIYLALAALFAASLLAMLLLPHGSLLKEIAAVPLVGALISALFQIVRDQTAHERQALLQDAQHRFALGASSHMANVAFNKHAQFAEEYVTEVFCTLDTLFSEGPSQEVLSHASKLFALRRMFAVWLTPGIDSVLQKFEVALRNIGANDWFLRNAGADTPRQKQIDEMYKTFADVLGKEHMGETWQGEALSEDVAIARVLQGLRAVLGVEELTKIRTEIIKRALDGAEGG